MSTFTKFNAPESFGPNMQALRGRDGRDGRHGIDGSHIFPITEETQVMPPNTGLGTYLLVAAVRLYVGAPGNARWYQMGELLEITQEHPLLVEPHGTIALPGTFIHSTHTSIPYIPKDPEAPFNTIKRGDMIFVGDLGTPSGTEQIPTIQIGRILAPNASSPDDLIDNMASSGQIFVVESIDKETNPDLFYFTVKFHADGFGPRGYRGITGETGAIGKPQHVIKTENEFKIVQGQLGIGEETTILNGGNLFELSNVDIEPGDIINVHKITDTQYQYTLLGNIRGGKGEDGGDGNDGEPGKDGAPQHFINTLKDWEDLAFTLQEGMSTTFMIIGFTVDNLHRGDIGTLTKTKAGSIHWTIHANFAGIPNYIFSTEAGLEHSGVLNRDGSTFLWAGPDIVGLYQRGDIWQVDSTEQIGVRYLGNIGGSGNPGSGTGSVPGQTPDNPIIITSAINWNELIIPSFYRIQVGTTTNRPPLLDTLGNPEWLSCLVLQQTVTDIIQIVYSSRAIWMRGRTLAADNTTIWSPWRITGLFQQLSTINITSQADIDAIPRGLDTFTLRFTGNTLPTEVLLSFNNCSIILELSGEVLRSRRLLLSGANTTYVAHSGVFGPIRMQGTNVTLALGTSVAVRSLVFSTALNGVLEIGVGNRCVYNGNTQNSIISGDANAPLVHNSGDLILSNVTIDAEATAVYNAGMLRAISCDFGGKTVHNFGVFFTTQTQGALPIMASDGNKGFHYLA